MPEIRETRRNLAAFRLLYVEQRPRFHSWSGQTSGSGDELEWITRIEIRVHPGTAPRAGKGSTRFPTKGWGESSY